MKLYIVRTSKGSWGDYVIKILGIYDSEEKAGEAIDKYKIQIGLLKSKYSLEEREKFDDLLMEISSSEWALDLEMNDFFEWNCTLGIPKYASEAWVEEIELNKEFDINHIL